MTDRLRAQYESYPYPTRDPGDETKRLITGSPSHLDELNHYVFAGALLPETPVRVLVAGGGTGDATIMLAQQLIDAGSAGRITYLDLSSASLSVAKARAEVRGLHNLRFHRGSLLALGTPNSPLPPNETGPFDYIDCCGVLHHLDDPAEGLRGLDRVLAPGGGIGLMVYAPHGRSGVYPLQEALRPLVDGLSPADQVALGRRVLRQIPESHCFRRNPLLSDHQQSDAGFYDLLLHSHDRPYTILELATLCADCGFTITGLIEPARYEPRSYVNDPRVLKPLETLPSLERAAWAERIAGTMTKHIVYLKRTTEAAGAVAVPDGPDWVPVLREFDGKVVARSVPTGGRMKADLHGTSLVLPLPRLAGQMLQRIDGRMSLGEIRTAIAQDTGEALDWPTFQTQFEQLYVALNGVNKLLLRRPRT